MFRMDENKESNVATTESPKIISEEGKTDKNFLPAAILIAGVLIAGSILYTKGADRPAVLQNTVSQQQQNQVASPSVENLKPISNSDHLRGDSKATLVIVEYSDPECPFCKEFHQTMIRLMNEYGGSAKLAWVYRHFPIPSLHPKAPAESAAMECAAVVGGNDKFWQYADEIFSRTNSNNSLDPAQLPKIANDIGLDMMKFNNCVGESQIKTIVDAESKDAVSSGAQGTPYSVLINTKTGSKTSIMGAQPYEAVKQMIEDNLPQNLFLK